MSIPKRKSVLQERSIAEDIGGRLQPGSGAPEFYKGDVRKAGELRVEAKTTSKGSFTLKSSELEKIRNEAIAGGEESWAMQVEFHGQFTKKKYAIIDWTDYLNLREKAKEIKNSSPSSSINDPLEGMGMGGPHGD